MSEKFGPMPIVVGVTGHRELRLPHARAIDASVDRIFADLAAQCPSTPIILLSGLAEGADRLVARIALKRGASLVVCLPFATAEFERDFAEDESRMEFRELLERASHVIEVPLADGMAASTHGRAAHYAAVGAFLARHSQVLIALWDGLETGKAGGTSEVVNWMLKGAPSPMVPRRSHLDVGEGGVVFHVMTPRPEGSGTGPANGSTAGELRMLLPDGVEVRESEAVQRAIRRNLEQFNADAAANSARLKKTEPARRARPGLDADVVGESRALAGIVSRHLVADGLALLFQQRVIRLTRLVFVAAFVAVLAFEIFAHVDDSTTWLVAYLGIMGAAFIASSAARRLEWERKHLDYRALAEGLRVQIAWQLAGLGGRASDRYLRLQRNELDWIRDGLAAWNLVELIDERNDDRGPSARRLDGQRTGEVLKAWVRDQLSYYRGRARQNEEAHRRYRILSIACIVAGFLCAGALLVFAGLETGMHTGHAADAAAGHDAGVARHYLVVGTVLSFLVGALTRAYSEVRAFGSEARRFEAMGATFATADRLLGEAVAADDRGRAVEIIEELATDALVEHGDWLLIHRDRQLEVPSGG